MRFLRVLITVLFSAVLVLTAVFAIRTKADTSAPTIMCDVKVIKEKCSVTKKKLLSHVVARDKKDGNLTDKVFVENISQFVSEGKSKVTFCVCDSDGNVAKLTRNIVYTDYEKPRLVLRSSLVYPSSAVGINLTGCADVYDKFDGCATEKLSIISGMPSSDKSKIPITFRLTNSKGAVYTWKLYALGEDYGRLDTRYTLKLKKHYIEISPKDRVPNFKAYIDKATFRGKKIKNPKIKIDSSDYRKHQEGTYDIWFELYSAEEGNKSLVAKERLIIFCGEN